MSEKVIDSVKLHEGFRSTADLFTSNFHSISYARPIDPHLEVAGATDAEAAKILGHDLVLFQRAAEVVLGEMWNLFNDLRRRLRCPFNTGPGNQVKYRKSWLLSLTRISGP